MGAVLALDAGKTGCRAVWYVDGQRGALVEVEGGPVLADRGGLDAARAVLTEAVSRVGPPPAPVTAVGLGLAGAGRHPAPAAAVADHLRTLLAASRAVVAGDVVTAHAGALGGGPGVVAVAGTGAVALGVGPDGRARTADGWGPVLGDEGGGHAIGRAGLVSALRAHDGRGGSAVLRARAERRFGPLAGIVAAVHETPNVPRTVAGFAPDVLAAADDGDREAVAIVAGAARAMAETVAAAVLGGAGPVAVSGTHPIDVSWTHPIDVSWAGSLFRAEAGYAAPFRAHLAALLPGARPVAPVGDALDGAHLLAAGNGGLHVGLLQVRP